jgi:hypothetical protein
METIQKIQIKIDETKMQLNDHSSYIPVAVAKTGNGNQGIAISDEELENMFKTIYDVKHVSSRSKMKNAPVHLYNQPLKSIQKTTWDHKTKEETARSLLNAEIDNKLNTHAGVTSSDAPRNILSGPQKEKLKTLVNNAIEYSKSNLDCASSDSDSSSCGERVHPESHVVSSQSEFCECSSSESDCDPEHLIEASQSRYCECSSESGCSSESVCSSESDSDTLVAPVGASQSGYCECSSGSDSD